MGTVERDPGLCFQFAISLARPVSHHGPLLSLVDDAVEAAGVVVRGEGAIVVGQIHRFRFAEDCDARRMLAQVASSSRADHAPADDREFVGSVSGHPGSPALMSRFSVS